MDEAEYRARCNRIQAGMAKAGLDGLVIAGRGLIAQNGFLIYVTGYCPVIRPAFAFLGRSGAPVILVTTESDVWLARQRGLSTAIQVAQPPADGTDASGIATLLGPLIAGLGQTAPRIGVVGLEDIIAADEFARWTRLLPDVTFTPATDIIGVIKAIKTPTDLAGMRVTADMVDKAFASLVAALSAGATLRTATGVAEASLRAAGAHEVLVYATSFPHFLHRPVDEKPARGSLLTVFVEASNPDGYWIELARLIAVGPLDADRGHIAALSIAAMDRAEAALRPGVTSGAAYAAIEQPIGSAGLTSGLWYGHGIGVDHDSPVIGRDVPALIESGMVLALHPHVVDPILGIGACICDSFVITETGAAPLSQFSRDVIEITG